MNRHITFILDRSGSMGQLRGDAIGAFNAYVADLAKSDPDATFQLALFDTEGIDIAPAGKSTAVTPLTEKTYIPRAGTPLWDAVGKVISGSQDNADTAYLVVIFTDGQENSSREWNREKLTTLLKEKETTGRWTFVYLGQNQDAWDNAQAMGIHTAGSTVTTGAGGAGLRSAMFMTSAATMDWAASNANNVATNPNAFYAGQTCPDCGDTLLANQTHVCKKAKVTTP